MSPKPPVLSGADLIRALRKLGYDVVRQKGSHVRLRNSTNRERLPITVPMHNELAWGTLRHILKDAGLTMEELLALL